jgi:hypothetical protein
VLEYVMQQGGNSGSFNIRIYRPPTSTAVQYDVNADVAYGCTASSSSSTIIRSSNND